MMQNINEEENKDKLTQSEIYQDLYMDMYVAMLDSDLSNGDELYASRRSNIYAIENTVRIWKQQFKD